MGHNPVVTPDEFKALNDYTNYGYVLSNAFLRGQCKDLTQEEEQMAIAMVTHMDAVFLKLPEPIQVSPDSDRRYVYRGIYSKHIGLQKSYTSTSITDYIAWSHYGFDGTVLKIDITDVRWIYMEPFSSYNSENENNINENEILLDRNVTFEVSLELDRNDLANPYRFANARYVECKAVKVADGSVVANRCKKPPVRIPGGTRTRTKNSRSGPISVNATLVRRTTLRRRAAKFLLD